MEAETARCEEVGGEELKAMEGRLEVLSCVLTKLIGSTNDSSSNKDVLEQRESIEKFLDELSGMEVHLDLLKRTRIGRVLSDVRKRARECNDDTVYQKAGDLIAKWKTIATSEFRDANPSAAKKSHHDSHDDDDGDCPPSKRVRRSTTESMDDSSTGVTVAVTVGGADEQQHEQLHNRRDSSVGSSGGLAAEQHNHNHHHHHSSSTSRRRTTSSGGEEGGAARDVSPSPSTDSGGDGHNNGLSGGTTDEYAVRRKSVELLEQALTVGAASQPDELSIKCAADIKSLAEKVEQCIFQEFKDAKSSKYRARVRSRVSNLKDELNVTLREMVLHGIIPPERLANMTAEELANDKMRNIRRSLTEELKDEHLLPNQEETHSTQFTCPKCKEKDCSYRDSLEKQQGDYEPIPVTLLVCNKCGNHWKNLC